MTATVYQSSSNGYVAYKVQSAKGSQASGSGGAILRQAGGAGANLTKAAIQSNEIRRDGMQTRGRHGGQKTTGAWTAEASLGSHETIIQAMMRDTWDVSALVLTQSDFTSLTTTANTIVAASGDWRTLGLRVGDVIRATSLATTANNSKNIRISGLTASTITTPDTLVLDATPDSSCTITRPKKLVQFAGGTLLNRYFTIDEYDVDIDQSTVLTDFMWGDLKISMAPNGLLMMDPGGIGTGQIAALPSGSSPLLTSPSETTAVPFSVVDATIRVGNVDVVELTSLDITMSLGLSSADVIGSKISPDVFPGNMSVAINFSALRKDLQYLTDFIAETPYSLHVLAVENESEPKDFMSIFVPNFTIGGDTRSALSNKGGPVTESISIPSALVGKDNTGAGYDQTMIKFQSTGA